MADWGQFGVHISSSAINQIDSYSKGNEVLKRVIEQYLKKYFLLVFEYSSVDWVVECLSIVYVLSTVYICRRHMVAGKNLVVFSGQLHHIRVRK